MNHFNRTGADPAPLDFNAPVRTESVADALVSELALSELPPPDAESLLEELGLPAWTVRDIVTSSSSPAL